MSWARSSGESLMPCFFCCGQPVAVKMPPLMMELPPTVAIFSRTTTEAPAFLASIAAARPPKPEPTMTTSAVSSHFAGSLTAPAAWAASVPKSATAPAATEPLRNVRRLSSTIFFSFRSMFLVSETCSAIEWDHQASRRSLFFRCPLFTKRIVPPNTS